MTIRELILVMVLLPVLVSSCVISSPFVDTRDIEHGVIRGAAGECVDVYHEDKLKCIEGQAVTAEGCSTGQVHCAVSCFELAEARTRCKGNMISSTAGCPLGQARCIATECSPESGGKKLACMPDQEYTNDGCPEGYQQCAPW